MSAPRAGTAAPSASNTRRMSCTYASSSAHSARLPLAAAARSCTPHSASARRGARAAPQRDSAPTWPGSRALRSGSCGAGQRAGRAEKRPRAHAASRRSAETTCRAHGRGCPHARRALRAGHGDSAAQPSTLRRGRGGPGPGRTDDQADERRLLDGGCQAQAADVQLAEEAVQLLRHLRRAAVRQRVRAARAARLPHVASAAGCTARPGRAARPVGASVRPADRRLCAPLLHAHLRCRFGTAGMTASALPDLTSDHAAHKLHDRCEAQQCGLQTGMLGTNSVSCARILAQCKGASASLTILIHSRDETAHSCTRPTSPLLCLLHALLAAEHAARLGAQARSRAPRPRPRRPPRLRPQPACPPPRPGPRARGPACAHGRQRVGRISRAPGVGLRGAQCAAAVQAGTGWARRRSEGGRAPPCGAAPAARPGTHPRPTCWASARTRLPPSAPAAPASRAACKFLSARRPIGACQRGTGLAQS